MKIPHCSLAPIGVALCLSLGTPVAFPTEFEPPIDAGRVLTVDPPIFLDLQANMSMYSTPTYVPPPKAPPKQHTPPSNNNALMRAQQSTLQAQRMIAQQQTMHMVKISVTVATKLQRKVAEDHARAFMALWKRTNADDDVASTSERSERRLTSQNSSTKTTQTTKKTTQTQKSKKRRHRHRRHKKLPRYIAVDTVKDGRSGSNAKRVVMIWDTQNESLVGNNVYDVKDVPSIGKTLRLDTYSADYVGAGNQIPADLRPIEINQ
jgi:hypothetical protein